MALGKRAIAAVRWTGLAAAGTTVVELLRVLITSRLLGPEDFGLMGIAYVVIGLAQAFLDVGMGAAIIHRQDVTRDELSSLYWLNLIVGAVVFVGVMLCTPVVALAFKEPRLPVLLAVSCTVFLISPIGQQFEILLRKDLSFKTIARIDLLGGAGSLAAVVVCGFLSMGVWTLVAAHLSMSVIRAALLAQVGYVRFRPALHFRIRDIRPFLSFGLYQLGTRLLAALRARFDQILIARFVGVYELGLYNFALNIVTRPQMRLNPIITRVAFPAFAKLQGDTKNLRHGYLTVVNALSAINTPILLGFAAVADPVIVMVFGEKWRPAIGLTQVLCCVCLLRSLHNPIGAIRLAVGRADSGFWWEAGTLVLGWPVMVLGGIYGGALGVALSLLAFEAAMVFPAYHMLIRPIISCTFFTYAKALMTPMAASLIMVLLIIAVPTSHRELTGVGLKILLGALVYTASLAFIDRSSFRQFVSFALQRSRA